ncbi:bifunctional 4-hydroxy-2-oxoglutarate aldolase/2-dehydro-3-deoxy-phosphogluconate aldolase [Actinoplanes sp. NBRC 103695]|uniref:bifunctional 4-hydroxy-2-oxoglutarate aldolase/2-dehydro-3-deoxy-phosphogluconate aldolase n=1 Tax=Actinoplanes sp. NBRC 103695 TaxID=3032202 RepID=UPI0024A1BE5C|nr:bifunctional 4-hydroxy-2-oxoglutarate aldolase/2-dehydro-3-deoxy-phosphogluconate aldolase [Actinoplanes sp. NBRC 103695]GLZ00985.1 2-dehydro-3-deoxy-phosphogluconate aldolase [Actinoplanes sp. NBRC 103695]
MTPFDLTVLRERTAVAILRSTDTRYFAATAATLARTGITLMEFALTTPGAARAILDIRADLPDEVHLGAGTVLDAAAADAAADAGAAFLVTPAVVPEVITAAASTGTGVLCGAYTATEVLTAHRAGALAVKIFPAGREGAAYCRALRDPLPDVPLVPTGGVDAGNAAAFLRAGACGLGLGRGLIGDATEGGSQRALADRAARLLDTIRQGREPQPCTS